MSGRRIEIGEGDVLVYKGMEFDQGVLDAVLSPGKRVLWAFLSRGENIMAVPFDESRCIWLEPSDVREPKDVEV